MLEPAGKSGCDSPRVNCSRRVLPRLGPSCARSSSISRSTSRRQRRKAAAVHHHAPPDRRPIPAHLLPVGASPPRDCPRLRPLRRSRLTDEPFRHRAREPAIATATFRWPRPDRVGARADESGFARATRDPARSVLSSAGVALVVLGGRARRDAEMVAPCARGAVTETASVT
jgi:hypothetical protein